ncbi:MAG: DNA primase [bacterium]|nr:DNA primase [bacterium]
MTNEVELIKQKLNLAEFIRDYVTLHPAGRNFKALCPFHQEKTPSFIVSPEKQLWRCFGSCGEGGDIIKFLMRYENIDFVEALKILAEKAGIELQNSRSPQQREVNVLYDLHEKAKDFFRESLTRRSDVLDYLIKDRGLLPATIEEFSLGFAPGGDYLMTHLVKSGYDINDIVKAGLASKNTRGLYRDRFDNRVVFPIFNHFGRPVAFTGRILPAVAESFHGDFIPPKYLNSPESLIFNKSKILYGFHKSKNEIARSQQIFLVEGQMDFLMSWQAGVKTAAAVSGSALSEHHLQAIRRLADTIFLNFDKDDAGVKALERSLELLGGFDFNIKVVDLGNFKDPAEAVKADSGFLGRAFEQAKHAIIYLLDFHFPRPIDDLVAKKRKIYYFLNIIQKLKNPLDRQFSLKNLAIRSDSKEEVLAEELIRLQKPENFSAPTEDKVSKRDRRDLIAERIVLLALIEESFLPELREAIDCLPVIFKTIIEDTNDPLAQELRMKATYELGNWQPEKIKSEFSSLLTNLRLEHLKEKRKIIQSEIKSALNKDDPDFEKKMKAFSEISREIDKLTGIKK